MSPSVPVVRKIAGEGTQTENIISNQRPHNGSSWQGDLGRALREDPNSPADKLMINTDPSVGLPRLLVGR